MYTLPLCFIDINQDTKLADRTVNFDGTLESSTGPAPETEPVTKIGQTVAAARLQSQPLEKVEPTSKIRQDLTEAQRSRREMQVQLQGLNEDLQNLRALSTINTKRINDLTIERGALLLKISDRDEELRGKAKLLEVRFLSNTSEQGGNAAKVLMGR